MRRVAITDVECLTGLGMGMAATWQGAIGNASGVRALDRYVPAEQTLQGLPLIAYAATLPASLEDLAGGPEYLKRWCEPAHHAVRRVVRGVMDRAAPWRERIDPQRFGVFGATALAAQRSRDILAATGKTDSKFILNQCHNMPLAVVQSELGLQGPSFSIGSACASAAHALWLAWHLIGSGAMDAAVVVGHEFPIEPKVIAGMDWVNALYRRDLPSDRAWDDPTQASRPYAADRRGLVLGEGAAAILLVACDVAPDQWPIRAIVRGAFANSDADHVTRAAQDNIVRCMRGALAVAECAPSEIECVSAHATSTSLGDRSELMAVREVLGADGERVPLVATKSQVGHTLGASAGIAVAMAVRALETGILPPTRNHVPDPELPPARIHAQAVEHRHRTTLVNAFGFGGTNLCIVLERGGDPHST